MVDLLAQGGVSSFTVTASIIAFPGLRRHLAVLLGPHLGRQKRFGYDVRQTLMHGGKAMVITLGPELEATLTELSICVASTSA